jgi:hypothetical protein
MTCSKCGSEMHREYVYKGIWAFSCLYCGNIIYPGFPKRTGDLEECKICGTAMEGESGGKKVCRECHPPHHDSLKPKPKREFLCVCGKLFTRTGNQRYCSDECTERERKKRRS